MRERGKEREKLQRENQMLRTNVSSILCTERKRYKGKGKGADIQRFPERESGSRDGEMRNKREKVDERDKASQEISRFIIKIRVGVKARTDC